MDADRSACEDGRGGPSLLVPVAYAGPNAPSNVREHRTTLVGVLILGPAFCPVLGLFLGLIGGVASGAEAIHVSAAVPSEPIRQATGALVLTSAVGAICFLGVLQTFSAGPVSGLPQTPDDTSSRSRRSITDPTGRGCAHIHPIGTEGASCLFRVGSADPAVRTAGRRVGSAGGRRRWGASGSRIARLRW